MKTYHFGVSSSAAYAPYILLLLRSFEDFLKPGEQIKLHVMTSVRDQEQTRACLAKLSNVQVHVISSDIEKLLSFDACLIKHVDSPTFYRLFLVDEVSKQESDLERFVHIDLDMLCVAPWHGLFTTDLGECICGAVLDAVINQLFDQGNPIFTAYRKDIGLGETDRYFNAGLLVIDVIKWRRQGIGAAVTAFLKQNPEKLRYAEQSVLNHCLRSQWLPLPYAYNHQVANLPEYRGEVIIVHYVGSKKPWSCGPMSPGAWSDRRNLPLLDHPLYQKYWNYQEQHLGLRRTKPHPWRLALARLAKLGCELLLLRRYHINSFRG